MWPVAGLYVGFISAATSYWLVLAVPVVLGAVNDGSPLGRVLPGLLLWSAFMLGGIPYVVVNAVGGAVVAIVAAVVRRIRWVTIIALLVFVGCWVAVTQVWGTILWRSGDVPWWFLVAGAIPTVMVVACASALSCVAQQAPDDDAAHIPPAAAIAEGQEQRALAPQQ
ncbi:hypothetical protein EV141_1759 [Microcella putealis]|uniref:Uncharacterized protein n=1 Tax=Microcella putealis TaxID=337005 RepID=A0A4Q7LQ39_9MICO|nr:hypothetical protein [Microcella putealis]RZS56302.1 hypothetical protein EV141_1759 [Microcella putealis]TQM27212.1 hypothetical protein BJ957_0642 [Microcella putealis]